MVCYKQHLPLVASRINFIYKKLGAGYNAYPSNLFYLHKNDKHS